MQPIKDDKIENFRNNFKIAMFSILKPFPKLLF